MIPFTPMKPGGATPITETMTLLRRSSEPMMSGLPPKRVCHVP
jgi:hypothetical protein